ncbi:MAG: alpha/beta hydrolase [Lacisediminihabitans sp.]
MTATGVAEAFIVQKTGQPISVESVTDRVDSFLPTQAASQTAIQVLSALHLSPNGTAGDGTGAALPDGFPASVLAASGQGGSVASVGVPSASAPTRVDIALLPKLSGTALLSQLALLPRGDLAHFVADNPRVMKSLVKNPPSALDVSAWWSTASPSARKSLVFVAPEVVGNLQGVPFDVRNGANRSYLTTSIRDLKSSMTRLGRGEIVNARLQLHMLEQVRKALSVSSNGPVKSLLTFDATGSGRASIVVGNLATADYVSYLVPGMFFSVDTALNTWTNVATELNREQNEWITRLAASEPSMAGKTVATVAWIGYQTPGITGIASLTLADQGADSLGRAIDGVQAVRSGAEPFVTLIGHSYGSTAAMIELAKGNLKVNALALIGSPGSAAQSVSQLSVANNNVFVGEAAWDPVVNSAFYGSDPGSGAFGAHKMSVAGGVDPITHHALTASAGHLGYFTPGSESMRNLALISLNQGGLVTQGTTMDASRTLP